MIPSALFIAYPWRFLHPVPDFDPDEFEAAWTYQQDPLWGLWDVARSPRDVIENGRGDCVDYARLSASWLYHHTDHPVALYVMGRVHNPPGHLVTYDGERVYSKGKALDLELREYCARSNRIIVIRRGIRDSTDLPRALWRP